MPPLHREQLSLVVAREDEERVGGALTLGVPGTPDRSSQERMKAAHGYRRR